MIIHEEILGYHLCERTLAKEGEVSWWGRYIEDPRSLHHIGPDGMRVAEIHLFSTKEELEEAICLHRLRMAAVTDG